MTDPIISFLRTNNLKKLDGLRYDLLINNIIWYFNFISYFRSQSKGHKNTIIIFQIPTKIDLFQMFEIAISDKHNIIFFLSTTCFGRFFLIVRIIE